MDKIRQTALLILADIDIKGAYMNLLIDERLKKERITGKDASFLSEIVRGTVRNRIYLDYVISKYSKIKLKKISVMILNILRMGLYQIIFMDKVPSSAAVNESVALAKRYGHQSSSGFVNAVLRNASKGGEVSLPDDEAERLSVKYSYPLWMVKRFLEDFGRERTENLLSAGNGKAETVIRANTLKISADELCLRLSDSVIEKDGNMITLKNSGSISEIEGFSEGLFTVQAKPFEKTAELLEVEPGMTVLDACAAPGGKTTYIAELMEDKGEIYACDIYEHKLSLINQASERLSVHIVKTSIHDASLVNEELKGKCDRVLLDVPCSGLGIIRRRPDIKWNRKEDEEFSALQLKILESQSLALKSGGILVYSTCSIDKRENEEVVKAFLASHKEFSLMPFEGGEAGYKTWYPDTDNTDGAFICRMKKN